MTCKNWYEPVVADDDLIFDPFQAAQFLRRQLLRSDIAAGAVGAIIGALDGRESLDKARETFVAAVKAAQLN